MNKPILTSAIFIATWALASQGSAQTYDANAAFKANELGASETSSVFGPFSVGYLDRLIANSFAPFAAGEHTDSFAGNGNTQGFLTPNNVIVPAAVVNVSTSPFSGFSGLDAGEILLHPGGRGGDGFAPPLFDGVIRFTAPVTGFYNITGSFRSLDAGITDNRIFQNGVSKLSITDAGNFRLNLQVTAGDVIDFATGAGGDGIGADSTGLKATLIAGTFASQVVNIDFKGKRPGDAGDAGSYAGVSAAGIGTVFNGISADSTGGNDNLTVSGFNLLSDTGAATTVGFSIGPVGGDHEPSQPFEPASLYDDYVFNNSAGNSTPGGSPFTISGLGGALTADLFLYGSFNTTPDFVIPGYAGSGVFGTYNGLLATAYYDVPVTGGSITGLFGVGETGVLGGLTVATSVPEPASLGLVLWSSAALLLRRRRNS